MAQIKKILKTPKLQASTLIETVIALGILLSSLSVAVYLISALYKERISKPEIEAYIRLCEYKEKSLRGRLYMDERKEENGLILERKITLYQSFPENENKPQILLISFNALSILGDTLGTQQRLVLLEE